MKTDRITDSERSMWINNDWGLYRWWKSSRLPLRAFIRANRDELTESIRAAINRPPNNR